ncbi:MAG: YraN family protein [Chloroflexaceae bacterium]|nr:YraN family protein [Chloroflexaceae bacterium]
MKRLLGDFGEQSASVYLMRHGYTILDRKWRCPLGEIDLIAREQQQLVFVEVRTRRGRANAAESITPTKQQRLIALAYTYLETHPLTDVTEWRIDVITLNIDQYGRVCQLQHFRNAIDETVL